VNADTKPSPSHEGKHGSYESVGAKKGSLELGLDFPIGEVLGWSKEGNACIVDEDIDGDAFFGLKIRNDVAAGRVVDVELHPLAPLALHFRDEVGRLSWVARCGNHTVTSRLDVADE